MIRKRRKLQESATFTDPYTTAQEIGKSLANAFGEDDGIGIEGIIEDILLFFKKRAEYPFIEMWVNHESRTSHTIGLEYKINEEQFSNFNSLFRQLSAISSLKKETFIGTNVQIRMGIEDYRLIVAIVIELAPRDRRITFQPELATIIR